MMASSDAKNDAGLVRRLKSPVNTGNSASLFPAQKKIVVGCGFMESTRSTWLCGCPAGTPRTTSVRKSTAEVIVGVGRLFRISATNTPGTARLVGMAEGSMRASTGSVMFGALTGSMISGEGLVNCNTFGTPGNLTKGSTSGVLAWPATRDA